MWFHGTLKLIPPSPLVVSYTRPSLVLTLLRFIFSFPITLGLASFADTPVMGSGLTSHDIGDGKDAANGIMDSGHRTLETHLLVDTSAQGMAADNVARDNISILHYDNQRNIEGRIPLYPLNILKPLDPTAYSNGTGLDPGAIEDFKPLYDDTILLINLQTWISL